MLTIQEVFNKSFLGVYNQGCQAMYGDGTCKYRGENGTKCAAGHVILDEHYRFNLENRRINYPSVGEALILSGVDVVHSITPTFYMLQELQNTHDEYDSGDFRQYWRTKCTTIATKFGLEMPPFAETSYEVQPPL